MEMADQGKKKTKKPNEQQPKKTGIALNVVNRVRQNPNAQRFEVAVIVTTATENKADGNINFILRDESNNPVECNISQTGDQGRGEGFMYFPFYDQEAAEARKPQVIAIRTDNNQMSSRVDLPVLPMQEEHGHPHPHPHAEAPAAESTPGTAA